MGKSLTEFQVARAEQDWARADRHIASLEASLRAAEDAKKTLRETVEDTLVWLDDVVPLLLELREDLTHSYEPEKGWPPHIDAAQNMAEDIKQMAADARKALATASGEGEDEECNCPKDGFRGDCPTHGMFNRAEPPGVVLSVPNPSEEELAAIANDVLTNPKWSHECCERGTCLAPTTHLLARALLDRKGDDSA